MSRAAEGRSLEGSGALPGRAGDRSRLDALRLGQYDARVDANTLTGRDAADAITLMQRFAAADARFDARRVAAALRSRVGRARLSGALALAVRAAARISTPRSGGRTPAGRSTLRAAAAAASPGRPASRGGHDASE